MTLQQQVSAKSVEVAGVVERTDSAPGSRAAKPLVPRCGRIRRSPSAARARGAATTGRGRRLRCRRVALQLLLLAGVSLLFASHAAGVGRETLVSNTQGRFVNFDLADEGSRELAQGFTTGFHNLGYVLDRVRWRKQTGFVTQNVAFGLAIHDGSTGIPGQLVASMAGPALLGADFTWRPPAGTTIRLDANRPYFLVVTGYHDQRVRATTRDGEVSGYGWTIANAYRQRVGNNLWPADGSGRSFVVILQGRVIRSLRVRNKTVAENAGNVTFTAELVTGRTPNSEDLTVDWATSDDTALAGSDYTSSSGTVTIPRGGNASATFDVPITNDNVPEPTETFTVTLSDARPRNVLIRPTITARITDDDIAAAEVEVTGATGLSTTEAGGTASFAVALALAPAADVTVALASSDEGEGTVSPEALTFTAMNWETAQTVTVTGVDDDDDDGDAGPTGSRSR